MLACSNSPPHTMLLLRDPFFFFSCAFLARCEWDAAWVGMGRYTAAGIEEVVKVQEEEEEGYLCVDRIGGTGGRQMVNNWHLIEY